MLGDHIYVDYEEVTRMLVLAVSFSGRGRIRKTIIRILLCV